MHTRATLIFLASIILTGCGGGGSGADAPLGLQRIQAKSVQAPAEVVAQEFVITFNGQPRSYHYYVPTNIEHLREYDMRGIKIVISLHDAGSDAATNAARTGWAALAEEKGFVAVFPSARDGSWNTTQDPSRDNDASFINSAVSNVRSRYGLSAGSDTMLTGIGQGATMAHELAMRSSSAAAVAAIGGVAEATTLALPREQLRETTVAVWQFRSLPTPLGANEQLQLDYWRAANRTSASGDRAKGSGRIQTVSYVAPENPMQQVRVSSLNAAAGDSPEVSRLIWDELFDKVVRFRDDTRTNGSLRPDLTIAEMGLLETTKEFNGESRRWLTYLPSNYDSLVAQGRRLPVIFSFHGRNGSARWQAQISEWHKVAETEGFIVVYPHGLGATWTTSIAPDNRDVQFFLSLLEEIGTRHVIDRERLFLNGSSMGTALTNRIAVQYPQLFAAIAPCYSGHLSAASYGNAIVRTDVPLPTWQCRGELEVPSDFPGGTAGETAARNFWRETVNQNFGPPTVLFDGRRTIEVWSDGLAEYRWQLTAHLGHFWHPDQARIMWDQMLSKYRRTADGALHRLP